MDPWENGTGGVSFKLDDDSGNEIAVRTTSITDDSWHHVAYTSDASSNRTGLKAYVDRLDVGDTL